MVCSCRNVLLVAGAVRKFSTDGSGVCDAAAAAAERSEAAELSCGAKSASTSHHSCGHHSGPGTPHARGPSSHGRRAAGTTALTRERVKSHGEMAYTVRRIVQRPPQLGRADSWRS